MKLNWTGRRTVRPLLLLLLLTAVLHVSAKSVAAMAGDDETPEYTIMNNAPSGSLSVQSSAREGETVFVYYNEEIRSFTAKDANGSDLTINGPRGLEMLTNGDCNGTSNGWSEKTNHSGYFYYIQEDGEGGYEWVFSWGTNKLWQTVNVVDMGVSTDFIDTGKAIFTASGQMRAPMASTVCCVKIYMLDASGATLDTITVLDDTGEYADWQSFSKEFALAIGTRQITYEMQGTDVDSWDGPYGPHFRRLSLTTEGYTFVMPASNVTIMPVPVYTITNNAPNGSLLVQSNAREGETVFVYCNEETRSFTAKDANGNDLAINGPNNDFEMLTNGNCDGTTYGWTIKSNHKNPYYIQYDGEGGYEWVATWNTNTLSQTLNVVDMGFSTNSIDTGKLLFTASGQMRAPWASGVCRVRIHMLDASGSTLETVTALDDKGTYDDWQSFSKEFALAAGTRQIKYEVQGGDVNKWEGTYGPHFRRLSLTTEGYTFVMPASNVTISAELWPTYTITTAPDIVGGTVSAQYGKAIHDTEVSLRNTPDADWKFGQYVVTDAQGNAIAVTTTNTEALTNGDCDGTFDGWTVENDDHIYPLGALVIQQDDDGIYKWVAPHSTSKLWQTVNVLEKGVKATDIDEGNAVVKTSGQMRAPWEKDGRGSYVCSVTVYMLDADGNTLSTVTVLNDRGWYTEWQTFSKEFALVAGTRYLKYEVQGCSALSKSGNYGPEFRKLSLTFCGSYFVMPTSNVTVSAKFWPVNVIVIDGNADYSNTTSTKADVAFLRSFTADDGYYSLMLPFSMTAGQAAEWGTFYSFDRLSDDGTTVHFKEQANGTEANTPYFFLPATTFSEKTVSGVTLEATTTYAAPTAESDNGLYGTYVAVTVPTGAYGYSAGDGTVSGGSADGGTFVKTGTGVSLPPFRAYLWLAGSPSLAPRLNAVFTDGQGSTTAIGTLQAAPTQDGGAAVYTLQGIRASETQMQRGHIYIINGKKTIRK